MLFESVELGNNFLVLRLCLRYALIPCKTYSYEKLFLIVIMCSSRLQKTRINRKKGAKKKTSKGVTDATRGKTY